MCGCVVCIRRAGPRALCHPCLYVRGPLHWSSQGDRLSLQTGLPLSAHPAQSGPCGTILSEAYRIGLQQLPHPSWEATFSAVFSGEDQTSATLFRYSSHTLALVRPLCALNTCSVPRYLYGVFEPISLMIPALHSFHILVYLCSDEPLHIS